MKFSLTFAALGLLLGAGAVFAQTAEHAPTKPAADAAAQYDRSLKEAAHANAKDGSDDSSSGGSTGTDPSATRNKAAPDIGETAAPNSTTGNSK